MTRVPDPADRRGILVELTAHGLEVVDEAIAAVWSTQAQLLADLTVAEREQLSALLRTLLLALEGEESPEVAPAPPRPHASRRRVGRLTRHARVDDRSVS